MESKCWPVNDVFPEFPNTTLRACLPELPKTASRTCWKINRDQFARLVSSNREDFAYYQCNKKNDTSLGGRTQGASSGSGRGN